MSSAAEPSGSLATWPIDLGIEGPTELDRAPRGQRTLTARDREWPVGLDPRSPRRSALDPAPRRSELGQALLLSGTSLEPSWIDERVEPTLVLLVPDEPTPRRAPTTRGGAAEAPMPPLAVALLFACAAVAGIGLGLVLMIVL